MWSIPNILDVFCVSPCETGYTLSKCNQTELADIEHYREKYLKIIDILTAKEDNNVWTIACSNHAYGLLDRFYNVEWQRVPSGSGRTVKDAVLEFMSGAKKIVSVDEEPWPNNRNCAY